MKTKASQVLKKMERLIDLVTMAFSIVMMFLLITLFSFAGLYIKSFKYALASGVIILMLAIYCWNGKEFGESQKESRLVHYE